MSTGNLTLPSDEDITNQMEAFEQQAAEDAEKKKRFEETMARHRAQAREEEARRAYAREHRYDKLGNDLMLLGQAGSGLTPQSTPQKPKSTPRIQRTPVRSAQGGYARRAFGTPSGKTPEEIDEDNFIRRRAAAQREAENRRLREELNVLEDVQRRLHEELKKNEAREMSDFLQGTGFGSGTARRKNTDKTNIKF